MKKCECGAEFDENKLYIVRINGRTIHILLGEKCSFCSVNYYVEKFLVICPICKEVVFPDEIIKEIKNNGKITCLHERNEEGWETIDVIDVKVGPAYFN
jgi:hypothetical protein